MAGEPSKRTKREKIPVTICQPQIKPKGYLTPLSKDAQWARMYDK